MPGFGFQICSPGSGGPVTGTYNLNVTTQQIVGPWSFATPYGVISSSTPGAIAFVGQQTLTNGVNVFAQFQVVTSAPPFLEALTLYWPHPNLTQIGTVFTPGGGFFGSGICQNVPGGATCVPDVELSGATALATTVPVITVQPATQAHYEGFTATFTVAADGTPAPTLQWQRSTNAGLTWTNLTNSAPFSGVTTTTLSVGPTAVSMNGHQYRAVATNVEGSVASNAVTLTVTKADIRAITIDPVNPNVVYAAAFNDGFFKSTNAGTTWSAINTGIAGGAIDVAVHPTTPSTVFGATNSGLYKSTNGGANWALVGGSAGQPVFAVAIDPVNPTNVYYATSTAGVFKSVNTGASFIPANTGLTATFTTALAIDPVTPINLYVGTSASGLFKSTDGGATWNPANTGLTIASISDLSISTSSPATLFTAPFNASLFKSTNSGDNWAPLNPGGFLGFMSVVVNPATAATVYAGHNGIGVFKSTDSGGTWAAINNGLTLRIIRALVIDPSATSTVYAGTQGGVFKTTDGGATWQETGPMGPTADVAPVITAHPTSQTVVPPAQATFTASATGSPAPTWQWQVSTNGGTTWGNLASAAPYSGVTTATLTVNPATGLNGNQYRAVATNTAGTATTNSATLTVNEFPVFSLQPVSQSVAEHATASFIVSATGPPAPTYQWQVLTDGGVNWTNLANAAPYSGVTTANLTITDTPGALTANRYRAIATNVAGSTPSNAAILTVQFGLCPTGVPTYTFFDGFEAVSTNWTAATEGAGAWSLVKGFPKTGLASAFGADPEATSDQRITMFPAVEVPAGGRLIFDHSFDFEPFWDGGVVEYSTNGGATWIDAGSLFDAGQAYNATANDSENPLGGRQVFSLDSGGVYTTTRLNLASLAGQTVRFRFRIGSDSSVGSSGWHIDNVAIYSCGTATAAPVIGAHPANQTVTTDGVAVLTVVASGDPVLNYQWQVSTNGGASFANLANGAPYAGATSAILTITNPTLGLNGNQYRVAVTNQSGSATSSSAVLTVLPANAPVFTTQPFNQTVPSGATATLEVAVSAAPVPTYQWQISTDGGSNWTNLADGGANPSYAGVTTEMLTIAAASTNGNRYRVIATNTHGTATSAAVVVFVTPIGNFAAPVFTGQPSNQTAAAPASTSFSVMVTGTETPTVQWQVSTNGGSTWADLANAAPYSGVATTTLSINPTALGLSQTQYRCIATNSSGTTTSNAATLTVGVPPAIGTPPAGQSIVSGTTATLNVVANGTAPLTYQWYQGTSPSTTTPIGGATSSSFTTPALTSTTSYWVRVTNGFGSADSVTATITVGTPPVIGTQPASQSIVAGTTATVTVVVIGTAPLTYQWYQGASPSATTPIGGATSISYTTPALTNSTSYWVRVTNAFGSADSATAAISVGTAPAISTQPASQSIVSGATATVSVVATGTAPLTYQWYQGASPSTTTPIGGATSSSYTTPVLTNTTGYWVRVSNGFGSADSATATIAVTPPLGPEIVSNGSFTTGATGWALFEEPDMVSSVVGGVFRFHKASPTTTASGQAVVFQHTNQTAPSGQPLLASFDIGNADTVRKRLSVLVIEADFSDLSVCTFWLPANAPLRTYQMKTHSTKAWTNAAIYFYAASAGLGDYLLDNVSLKADPSGSSDRTDCVDPTAPTAPGGEASANLLTNGDFATGALSPWGTFGDLTSQITGGVFEFIRPGTAGQPAGVILQPANQAMTANQILTASFQLGNSSTVRKRVTVLLHDLDFSDLSACTFWLPPGQALSTYQMRGFATKAWTNATISVYAATTGPEQWIRLDNVTLQRTPATATQGMECLEPGAVGPIAAEQLAALAATGPGAGRDAVSALQLGTNSVRTHGGALTFVGETSAAATEWQAEAWTTGRAVLQWTEPIDLTNASSAHLTFESWLESRGSTASVQVSVDGANWQTIMTVPAADRWTTIDLDLGAFSGQTIYVRLVFDGVGPAGAVQPDTWRVRAVARRPIPGS